MVRSRCCNMRLEQKQNQVSGSGRRSSLFELQVGRSCSLGLGRWLPEAALMEATALSWRAGKNPLVQASISQQVPPRQEVGKVPIGRYHLSSEFLNCSPAGSPTLEQRAGVSRLVSFFVSDPDLSTGVPLCGLYVLALCAVPPTPVPLGLSASCLAKGRLYATEARYSSTQVDC